MYTSVPTVILEVFHWRAASVSYKSAGTRWVECIAKWYEMCNLRVFLSGLRTFLLVVCLLGRFFLFSCVRLASWCPWLDLAGWIRKSDSEQ